MFMPVCRSFGVFPSFLATSHTLINEGTFSLNALNISGRILSSLAVFPDFNPRIIAATSVNVKTSFFLKSTLLHVLVAVAFTELNKSSKHSLYRERVSFLFLRTFPVESLTEVVVLGLFPRNRQMVCQNTLPFNSWNQSDDQTFPKNILWIFLLPELQLFSPHNTEIANQMTCFATRP